MIVSGSNPKDWKRTPNPHHFHSQNRKRSECQLTPPKVPNFLSSTTNEGDDIAGIVTAVGSKVFEFHPGDRVAAFHEMRTPHGSYAEYALAWQHTTFHIPASTTFEEAAALPLAAMTAALGLYQFLRLPQPWPARDAWEGGEGAPLVIYGAASAVGVYALQLAKRSGIHPLLCIAGRAQDYVAQFLDPSQGDVLIDYRQGDEHVISSLTDALQGRVPAVLDAVASGGSVENIGEVFRRLPGGGEGGKVTYVLDGPKDGVPEAVEQSITRVGFVHKDGGRDFGYVYFRYFARGLQEGWFKPQRTEVVPGGLAGIEGALVRLKEGKASGVKYVFRIGETEGVAQ